RSSSRADAPTRSDYDRPETIEETAGLVSGLGGKGVAIAVDHLEPAQVAALAERIRSDHGRIDVLVNDIWGAEVLKGGPPQWNTPIWKLDLQTGFCDLRAAARAAPPAARLRGAPGDVALSAAALGREARRPARRSHRRHHGLQRAALPDLGVLRPRQAQRESPGVLARP